MIYERTTFAQIVHYVASAFMQEILKSFATTSSKMMKIIKIKGVSL